MGKIDACCEKGDTTEKFWNKIFQMETCEALSDFDTFMEHKIATQIKITREEGKNLL